MTTNLETRAPRKPVPYKMHKMHQLSASNVLALMSLALLSAAAAAGPHDIPSTSNTTGESVHGALDSGLPLAASRRLAQSAAVAVPAGWSWNIYHNYNQIRSFMVTLAKRSKRYVKTYTLGKSAQGREMRMLEITDFTGGAKGFRPAVRLMGAIHGDEIANAELILRFAHYLASQAASDPRVGALLASTRIYIVPVLNPDGFTARTRHNSNGVDLNRNFPVTNTPYVPPTLPMCKAQLDTEAGYSWCQANAKGPQPETSAIMNWIKQAPAILSLNAHGGAVVASYALDACDTKGDVFGCPTTEDPLPKYLAQMYSFNSPTMSVSEMYLGQKAFDKGVVNGALWYPVLGSLQDYLWFNTPELDLTVELHNEKIPGNDFLGGMWSNNLDSLMRFSEAASMGIQGIVIDPATKQLLPGAVVEAVKPKRGRLAMSLPPASGASFYRLLVPGRAYCLRVRVPGRLGVVLLAVKPALDPSAVLTGKGVSGLMLTVTVPVGAKKAKKVYNYGGGTICRGV